MCFLAAFCPQITKAMSYIGFGAREVGGQWNRCISIRDINNQVFFLAWHGAVIETTVFLDVFEISGNLKSSQKVAIFRKDGTYIARNRYVASIPEMLIYNWNNQILYAIITVKFSFTVRVFCWDNLQLQADGVQDRGHQHRRRPPRRRGSC